MSIVNREYSAFASGVARKALDNLLLSTENPKAYSETMNEIGLILGKLLSDKISEHESCLLASTAEDADFLSKGVYDSLREKHDTKAAVFWNNHYAIPGGSIAPIVHKFIEPGYEKSDVLVIVKSVISGSCVVRTNILELIQSLNVRKIHIVSPVMHEKSEAALRNEFPDEIADMFEFLYFAIDKDKGDDGEVRPGIGGQIYELLGLTGQPARVSFMPQLVKNLAFL